MAEKKFNFYKMFLTYYKDVNKSIFFFNLYDYIEIYPSVFLIKHLFKLLKNNFLFFIFNF